jgi:type I restriction enzyme S subunit
MIEKLKPHEALRPSGDPWLGDIPKHWSQKRLWSMSSPRVERNPGNLPLLSVFLDRGVIPYGEGGGQVHAPSLDLSNYQVVHPGDFVLNNQQAWRGSVGVSRHHGIISPAYIVLRLNGELLPAYANYLFRCSRLVDQFVAASKGVGDIQRQVFWPFLRHVTVPIPSTNEQAATVRFLDHANQRIDEFIRTKKKLIALLNEQKQAIVHLAVTRGTGLDDTSIAPRTGQHSTAVTSAPGRIPWLSEVPPGWKMTPSGQLFAPRKELAREGDKQLSATQAYGVIHQAEFERRVGRRVVKISMHLEKRRHVERDDFVISMRSFQGGVERARVSGCIRSSYVVLRPRFEVDTGYFGYLFKSTSYIRALQATANFIRDGQDLNFDNFRLVELPLPPLEVQRAIADHIDSSTAGLTKGVEKARQEIRLLAEYRTRLISDVVTGQVDVRAAAASLPDIEPDAAPPESSDDGETDIDDNEAA